MFQVLDAPAGPLNSTHRGIHQHALALALSLSFRTEIHSHFSPNAKDLIYIIVGKGTLTCE